MNTLTISPTFDDPQDDYYLVAKIDSDDAVTEYSEDNNTAVFQKGAFIVHEATSGQTVLHIAGSDAADPVSVAGTGTDNWQVLMPRSSVAVPAGASPPPYYDVTGNGIVNDLDIAAVQRVLSGPAPNWQNYSRFDVTYDFVVTPADALVIINALNATGERMLTSPHTAHDFWYDVNGDGVLSVVDANETIDVINGGSGEVGAPWRNPSQPFDVNNDGPVTIADAEAIQNYLALGEIDYTALALDQIHIRTHGGDDAVAADGAIAWLFGGAGNDSLTGGELNDVIAGGLGNDTISAGDGNDVLYGGNAPAQTSGGSGEGEGEGEAPELGEGESPDNPEGEGNDDGDDTISGGNGNDQLYGGTGDDTLNGDDGDDYLDGGPGNNQIDGGPGNNIVSGIGPCSADGSVLVAKDDDWYSGPNLVLYMLFPDVNDCKTYAWSNQLNHTVAYSQPLHGQVTANPSDGEELIYTPTYNYFGDDSFTYTITDGQWSSTATVHLHMTDAAPWDMYWSNGDGGVPENSPSGTSVGRIRTWDDDPNDTFTTSLVSGEGDDDNGLFYTDGQQIYSGAMFDTESKSSYHIRVRQTDLGGLFIEAPLDVYVGDVNEPPTSITLSNDSIDENSAGCIGTLGGTDPDSADQPLANFELVSGDGDDDNGLFSVQDIWALSTEQPFDYETQNTYSIRVRVTDHGGLTREQPFTIHVNDVDEQPVIDMDPETEDDEEKSATAEIHEDATAGTVVGQVPATDPDTGESLTYAITSGNDDGLFSIDASGTITLAQALSNPATFDYPLGVRVTDAHGLYDVAMVMVLDKDVNHPPVLDVFPKTKGVSEKSATVHIGPDRKTDSRQNLFTQVTASDPDREPLIYDIVNGNPDGLFTIDAGGKIKLAKDLSAKTTNTYNLRIRVSDPGGLFDEGNVTVIIDNTSVGITGDTQGIEGTTDVIRLKIARVSSDFSAPLTVKFFVTWNFPDPSKPLKPADFYTGQGLTDLLAGRIVIPANSTTYTIELAPRPDTSFEGVETATISITPDTSYVIAGDNADSPDASDKANAIQLHPNAYIQVVDKLQLFASGTPTKNDGTAAEPIYIHRNDVIQGGVGDCYLMAAMAAIANRNPSFVNWIITANPQNPLAFTVKLWSGAAQNDYAVNFSLTRGWDSARFSGDYNNNGVEIWPQVIEQAYAALKGGYANIDTATPPSVPWKALTGKDASDSSLVGKTDAEIAQMIYDAADAVKVIILATRSDAPDLVPNHAYYVTFAGPDGMGGKKIVVYDPHGKDGKQLDLLTLSRNFSGITLGDTP